MSENRILQRHNAPFAMTGACIRPRTPTYRYSAAASGIYVAERSIAALLYGFGCRRTGGRHRHESDMQVQGAGL
jgi:hypothetical protein